MIKKEPVVSRLLEEKEDIKLKIDRARKHASLLNKERLELTQTLSTIRKEVETVKLDNFVLEGAVNSGLKELSVLKSRNGELKRQLTEIEADKTILALDEQIIVLEDLIEEKKKQEKNGDIIILEDSLKVASDRKKEVIKTKTRTYEKNVQDVSRNLLASFQFPESSKIVDYSVESNSAAVESNLFPISCRGSDPLTCVEQINLQKDKSGSKVAGNEHSINVACSKVNWDEDDSSNYLETSDNSKEHETVASLNHLSPQSKSNDLENRDNPKEHETVSFSNRLTPRPQFSCIGPKFFSYRPPQPQFSRICPSSRKLGS